MLAVALTNRAADSLEHAVEEGGRAAAVAAGERVDFWLSSRLKDLEQVAVGGRAEAARGIGTLDRVRGAYDVVEVLDARGRVVASSRPGRAIGGAGEPWFRSALNGTPTLSPIELEGQGLRWIAAAPVREGGRITGVVAADLDATELFAFLHPAKLGETGDALIFDGEMRLLVRLRDGRPRDEAAMARAGALRMRQSTVEIRRALAGEQGAVSGIVVEGEEVLSGFAPITRAGWAVIVRQGEDEAFSAIADQRELATAIVLVGSVITILFALWFARRQTRPLTQVATAAQRVAGGDLGTRVQPGGASELVELGGSFNRMVESLNGLVRQIDDTAAELSGASTELSSAAEELASSTAQQTTAATETSATMEELARTSAGIAETVSSVSRQTAETREVLELADSDMQQSSTRMLGLAERVAEISGLLELIHDIADQTNLLALNAAIEAARAGEAGRGFTVVADEVRRLAERSKLSAADIEQIIDSAQNETNATVMAMEKSSKQMQRGLDLMDSVAEATEQVRLTTQQQGAATREVVGTMDAVTETTRQTAVTAQQIAASASSLNELVEDLRRAAAAAAVTR